MPSIDASDASDTPAGAELTSSWALLLAVRSMHRASGMGPSPVGLGWSQGGELLRYGFEDPRASLRWTGETFRLGSNLRPRARDLLDLYLPMLDAGAAHPLVVGHLGQSLDARIATACGDSFYVTGPQNRAHLHRMRALCDAVVVGAETVAADNPRLTTRLVPGPHPVRVVIDSRRRLPAHSGLFTDGEAPCLIACAAGSTAPDPGGATVLEIPTTEHGLSESALRTELGRRGLHSLFVEGGGDTVTRWFNAGQLDRLQIAAAPVLVGAGRPGLALPGSADMASCLRPAFRIFRMGQDLLWDLDLRARSGAQPEDPDSEVLRIL